MLLPHDKVAGARHDHIVTLVERMLELHKRLAAVSESDRELSQRQTARPTFAERGVDATDREIDRLVHERHGLTQEEIRIVEGND